VSILKNDRIAMISRFEESSCNDWRHWIPEKKVLLMAVNRVGSTSQLAYPNIPPDPIQPVAHEELNGFRYMQNFSRARADKAANFSRNNGMLESLHKIHR
jgi:hypothetical protein